jgi:hypothetical protein
VRSRGYERRAALAGLAAFGWAAVSLPAAASLVGDIVHYEFFVMEMLDREAHFLVIGDEIDFVDRQQLEVDVEADTITLTVAPPLVALGFVDSVRLELSDLDWSEGPIESISVMSAEASGFDPQGVSFSDDAVTIELGGVVLDAAGFIEVTLPQPTGAASGLAFVASLLALASLRRSA